MIHSSSKPVYGLRPLIEAIESGKTLNKLFLQKGLRGANYQILHELIRKHRIPFQGVPLEKLNRLTQKNHQGVFAFMSPVDFYRLEDLLPQIYEAGKTPLLLVLDGITDVRNFGAIVRTAECGGVDAVIIPAKGAAPVNDDAIKTSAGAIFKLPVCKENDLVRSLRFLKNSGVRLIAATEKAGAIFYKSELLGPLAIILGNEEEGISSSCLALADERLKLPVLGEITSLNVSVASGVLLYETMRQRLGL
ncbi:23S rRNA (guanosine(2251)-2'-O)-methyltransferase RlmB [Bacteroidetes bacterium endosymbiont of Geopemphigus sp.]|uniref:23S rRNA (guanosine(2251)-2'-O)-methyltransferase RlmB n=1 Tax=Bacteroidetes bacterium endosymbiont of Geopemphigus sp. TaxID=2047937 RepID=UPI000CD29755|nr:23S rRNA (guanosine(2251)-2'-O)-methyltransferase RlmB [Bacteroidetes bacterium endosymbiont of Geopemphigus sp.]